MPDYVQLTVRVDKTQLDSLRSEIDVIKKRGVDVKITASGADEASNALKNYAGAAKEAAHQTESLWDNFAKFGRWYLVGNAFTSIVRSLKDALATLKEVDSALVAVRKTTDFSEEQIASLTEKTYELAKAYGRTADELLNLSATFARAGMGDRLAEMTELAALVENVGDVEGDAAAKFLLAANAAWQLGADYSSLMGIIDGMNAVTNQAAVDMEALTTGITVAGSVFANAGESAQTYTAMVGTAVAATQRSGAEISRGLRTIAMNIRAIKGELDDGEIIDDASISDASAALHSVGISVADANGELRLTSDVLSDLAEKWSSLTTAEQSYLAQSLAGKRQANILTALMQNWGEVERQMELYANGAGSALRENELYLDSWAAKSKQLTAAWTEFVSHFADTDMVKGAIDVLNATVEGLDTGAGHLAVGVSALAGAWTLFNAAVSSSNPVLLAVGAALAGVVTVVGHAKLAHEEYEKDLHQTYAELYNLKDAVDAFAQSQEQSGEAYRQSAAEAEAAAARAKVYAEMLGEVGEGTDEYRAILSNLVELYPELSGYIDEETGLLNIQGQELVDLIDKWREYALQRAAVEKYTELFKQKLALEQAYEAAKIEADTARQQLDAIASQMSAIQRQFEATAYWKSGGADYSDYEEYNRLVSEYVDLRDNEISGYNVLTQKVSEYDDSLRDAGEALEATNTEIDSLDAAIRGQATSAATATKANGEYANSAGNAQGEAQTLAELMKQVEDGLNEEADAATNAAMQTQFYALQAALASGQPIDTASAITSLSGLSAQSTNTAAALQALIAVFQQIESMDAQISSYTDKAASATGRRGQLYASRVATLTEQRTNFNVAEAFQRAYAEALANMPGETSGGGGGGGGSQTDEMLENYKQIVSLEEQRLSFLEASGASVEEQVEQAKAIQSALHDEADYLRSIGGDEEDILKLSTEWWKYQDKISELLKATDNYLDDVVKYYEQQLSLLKESGASNEQIEAKMREIMAVLEQQILALQQTDAYLKGDLATLTQITQLQTQWYSYQNQISDLYKEEETAVRKTEDVLSGVVKLRKNELSYLEESGASTDAIAGKMREIQSALMAQVAALKRTDEYLSGNADTLAEVVSLQTQWLQYQNQINELYREELAQAVEKVKTETLELIDAQEEAAVGPLQKQLEILEAQQKAVEDTRTEEERLLAVEKARVALQNAQNERNIRQYNAQTGQWEWAANAETVSKAQAALEDAEKALADYYTQREITMLKDQISSLETEYDALRDAVSDFSGAVIDGTEDYRNAAKYLSEAVNGMSETVQTTAAEAAGAFSGLAETVKAAAEAAAATMMSGAEVFAAAALKAAATKSNASKRSADDDYIATEAAGWAKLARSGGNAVEAYRTEQGVGGYYTAKAKSAAAGRTADDVIAILYGGVQSGQISRQEAVDTLGEITSRSGIQGNQEKYRALRDAMDDFEGGVYDGGGILPGRRVLRGKKSVAPDPRVAELHSSGGGLLKGIGGIKATTEDEMILPPDITKGLLTAQNSGAFDALLGSLGIVTAAAESVAGIGGGVTRNSIGSQHYGDNINLSFNGAEFRSVNAGTTIGELAEQARNLSLRGG